MVMSIFDKNLFYTLQTRFFVACSSHWDKLRCRRSRRNAATKLMYVPINFYHGGALLVQRASLGDHSILWFGRGGSTTPPYPDHAWLRPPSTASIKALHDIPFSHAESIISLYHMGKSPMSKGKPLYSHYSHRLTNDRSHITYYIILSTNHIMLFPDCIENF